MAKERRMFMFYNSSKHGQRNHKKIYFDNEIEVWYCSDPNSEGFTVNFIHQKDGERQKTEKDLTAEQRKLVERAVNRFADRKDGDKKKLEFKRDVRELLKEKGIPTHDENGNKLGLRRRIAMLET